MLTVQEPLVSLHTDTVAMLCAAAENAAVALNHVSLLISKHHKLDCASRKEAPPPSLITPFSGGDTNAKASLQSQLLGLVRSAVVSFAGLSADVHIGPADVVTLQGSGSSSHWPSGFTMANLEVQMNGSPLVTSEGLDVSISKVCRSTAPSEAAVYRAQVPSPAYRGFDATNHTQQTT